MAFSLGTTRDDAMETEVMDLQDHVGKVAQAMLQFRVNEMFCDVEFLVGPNNRRVAAHRAVLAASSEFFYQMFIQDESYSVEFDVDVFESLVVACYSGQIQVNKTNAVRLLEAATFYEMKSVVDVCCDFISRKMDETNCLDVYNLTKRLGLISLTNRAFEMANERFMALAKTNRFLDISLEVLTELLASSNLVVNEEEDVFDIMMLWVNHLPDQRNEHISELLPLIRLSFLDSTFIFERVRPVSSSCPQLVMDTLLAKMTQTEESAEAGDDPRDYIHRRRALVVGALKNQQRIIVESYDPTFDQWTTLKTVWDNRMDFSCSLADHKLIIGGGWDADGNYLSSIITVNLETGWVDSLPSMQTPRSLLSFAKDENDLYAIGGVVDSIGDTRILTDSVERFDAGKNSWTPITPMIIPRFCAQCVVVGGLLYVAEGFDEGHNWIQSFEVYNPRTNQWTLKQNMEEYFLAVGDEYCFNGDSVMKLDSASKTVTHVMGLNEEADSVLSGRVLYELGLKDYKYDPVRILKCCLKTQHFTELTPMRSSYDFMYCGLLLPNTLSAREEDEYYEEPGRPKKTKAFFNSMLNTIVKNVQEKINQAMEK